MEWTRSTPLQFATEVLLLLYQESLFTVRTVDELLWGYRDRLLSTIHLLHPEIDPVFGLFNKVTAVQDVLVLYKGMAPFRSSRVVTNSWISLQMNGTDDGEYVFLSGETDYLNFMRIVEWKGKE